MAGEFEECDTLPTGSISFGRFETETLSWERRSSFSHNRYIEEVEKCSTPGSVTQKKAYFEAHFKKKGILPQPSIGSQDGVDDGPVQLSLYDESPILSEGQELTDCNDLSTGSSHANDVIYERGCLDYCANLDGEKYETHYGNDSIPTCEETTLTASEKSDLVDVHHDGVNFVEEVPNTTALPDKTSADLQNNAPKLKKTEGTSIEVKGRAAQILANTKLKYQSTGSSISVKLSIVKKLDRESTQARKTEKQSLGVNTQNSSDVKSHKSEGSKKLKEKIKLVSKRNEDLNQRKGVEVSQTTENFETDIHDSTRPKRATNAAMEVKQNTKTFFFKSNERAEKRKEFNMKLEEKLHAKEVEMNELQTKTKEETDAEIKQLRRSLNFKATPMPSFYRGAQPKHDGKKVAAATPIRSSKLQGKSPTSKTSVREKSPDCSAHTDHTTPMNEKISAPDVGSLAEGSKLEKGDERRTSEFEKMIGTVKKDEKVGVNIQQQPLDGNRRKKCGKVVNRERSSGLPKNMKGTVGGRSVSAVHVAS